LGVGNKRVRNLVGNLLLRRRRCRQSLVRKTEACFRIPLTVKYILF
jgi:hypothetical protein